MTTKSYGQLGDMILRGLNCSAIDVNLATDQTVAVAVPCAVLGYWINVAMSAHSVQLSDGATAVVTIPASGAAGAYIQFPGPVVFATNLTIDPNVSSTGHIVFFYRTL